MAWQNPDVAGAVTYDGFDAKIDYILTPPTGWASRTGFVGPKLAFEFMDNASVGKRFDIHPGALYQGGTAVEDATKQDIVKVTKVGTDLCTEKWYLSDTAIACVELRGTLKRKRNTGDTTDDIILDYSNKYMMHAAIGIIDTEDNALKFAAVEVDFTQFFEGGAQALSATTVMLGAVLYSLAF